jgi:Asp-tRNA(Asn)/Glu-tRNA(Gln) amidotransferase A subunit family amidase
MYNWIKDGTKDGQGMALNVQIVGKPWNEEMVLRVMKELQAGVKPNMPVHL